MGNSTWNNDLDPFPIARGAAFNAFTTAKDVSPVPLKYCLGDELKKGSIVELLAVGEYSTTGTPTMRLGFAYGITSPGGLLSTGVALAGSDLVATVSGAASFGWKMHYLGLVTDVGPTGVIYGHGFIELASTLIAAAAKPIPVTAGARSATIDTTVKKTWHVFAEFGTSSGSNQVIVDAFSVTIRNQGKAGQ